MQHKSPGPGAIPPYSKDWCIWKQTETQINIIQTVNTDIMMYPHSGWGGVICINMGMSCVENVYMGAYGDQESDPLQLEVWAVVSCLMRVLWTELGWYRRPASPAAISPALGSTFWLLSYGPADLLIGTCNSYKLGSKYSSQTAKAQTKTLWRDASRSEHNKYGSGRPCPSTLPSSLLKIVRLHSQS